MADADSRNKEEDEDGSIDEAVNLLTLTGHRFGDVWEYTYSEFQSALKFTEKAFKLQALSVTAGIAACFDKNVLK